jgi:NAD(P)-dependent dehydrogenase (short-subunit alcohol dehydrogenase family)
MDDKKIAIVTGSSSGIGYETSLAFARNGFDTYATMRNLDKSNMILQRAKEEMLPLQVAQLDVVDDNSVKAAVGKVMSEKGRIDILVNNAGYGLFGALEDISIEEIKAQFETNFFGSIRMLNTVIPIMRTQRSGILVNISSGAGLIGFPILSGYVSSKFALEGLCESLSYEIEQFGIRIILIEPGCVKTNFVNGIVVAKNASNPNSPYSDLLKKFQSGYDTAMQNAPHPEKIAKVILQTITNQNPKFRYNIGEDINKLMDTRKKMSDLEFHNLMVQTLL